MTSDTVSNIPPSVFSLVCVVVFHPERGGLGELLLDSFLLVQNPKTSHDRELLREVCGRMAGYLSLLFALTLTHEKTKRGDNGKDLEH